MKKYIKFTTVLMFLSFSIHTSCNNDDDVVPVSDADVQDPDAMDDSDVSADYLVLKAFYKANTGNTLGWELDDTSMESWVGVTTNNDKVTQLTIQGKSIDSIPPVLSELKEISTLDISKNYIAELPVEIGALINLEELEITGNPLTVIPQEICNLELTGTTIQKNEFTMFCSGTLIDYEALKALYQQNPGNKLNWGNNNNVSDINMTNWEGVVLIAGRVTSLILTSDRELIHLVKEIGDLEKLDHFSAQECGFNKVDKEIGKLKSLTFFSMADNQLDEQSLEEEFFDLENLIELRLEGNNFMNFPSEVDKLSSLTKLSLSNNSLNSVPLTIGNMQALDTISLQRNTLDKLPEEFAKLNEATFINLESNPLDPLLFPERVCALNLAFDSDQIADGICQ